MNFNIKQKKNKIVCGICMFGIMLFVLAVAKEAQAVKQVLTPQKDAEVNKLLLQQISPTSEEQAQVARKLLSEMPTDRCQSALAYALLWRETRTAALEYLMKAPPEAPLMPFLLDAAKWGTGRDQLLVVRIFKNNPDKRAVPVLLEVVLENDYMEWYSYEVPGIELRHVQTADLWVEAAMLLNSLTDGAIGWPEQKRSEFDGTYVDTPSGGGNALTTWRAWWEKNHAKVLPDWKPDDIGNNEDEIRKWCEERITHYGDDAKQEVENAFEQCVTEKAKSAMFTPNDYGSYSLSCPSGLAGPAATPVLILKILESADKIPAAEPANDAEIQAREEALRTQRIAVLCLSASMDHRPVSQFLLWALKNGKIKDLQAAAHVLGRLGGQEEAVDALLFILEQKLTARTQNEVARSLGLTQSARAIEPLIKILQKDDPPKVASSLVQDSLNKIATASKSNGKVAVDAVAPVLISKNADHVKVALSVLRHVKGKDAIQVLRDALPNITEDMKPEAGKTLQRLLEQKKGTEESTSPPDGGTTPPAEGGTTPGP